MYIPTVVLDFDGVIHSYKSGWKGAAVIPDPPVDGIKEAIEALMERGYRVVIVSARSATAEGQTAIRDWLKKYDIPVVEIMAEKPPPRPLSMRMTGQSVLTVMPPPSMRKSRGLSHGMRKRFDMPYRHIGCLEQCWYIVSYWFKHKLLRKDAWK